MSRTTKRRIRGVWNQPANADKDVPDIDEDIRLRRLEEYCMILGDGRRASLVERARKMNDMCKNATFKDLIAYQEKMDSRLSLTVLRILRTPQESSSESSSQASFDMFDEAAPHEATPTEKFEMKVRRGFRKLSSPHLDPSGTSEVHAK